MLILSRKVNETVVIDGRIIVKVLRVEGEGVKLGIEAPAEISVHRQEVYDEIQRNNREAATQGGRVVPQLRKDIYGKTASGPEPGEPGSLEAVQATKGS